MIKRPLHNEIGNRLSLGPFVNFHEQDVGYLIRLAQRYTGYPIDVVRQHEVFDNWTRKDFRLFSRADYVGFVLKFEADKIQKFYLDCGFLEDVWDEWNTFYKETGKFLDLATDQNS